ncbi:MAG: bifunctional riboflavin kinase/FAD synthetase [Cocleimonas sp.]|nr:bifunctional riboflavin kinase/FAD synthetase [Cocleimonas sp.]
MRFLRRPQALTSNDIGCVASIGNFDGLHLGHRKIINQLKEKSTTLKLPLTIISFEPLPSEYFMPEPPARIYPQRDKVRLLQSMGVDNFLCLKFDAAFSQQSPEDFVNKVLIEKLGVKYFVVGDDFRFGHQRKGNFQLLKKIGDEKGMQVVDTPTCDHDNKRISSTRIRTLLEAGNIKSANALLGARYQLSGRVRHGDKRGRTIGFPTLNLKVLDHLAPARGVYAVRVSGLSDKPLTGVANLGARPTVNGTENRLETHLFDFDGDVYGKYICVELAEFLRAEQKFDDFGALKLQISGDAEHARKILAD